MARFDPTKLALRSSSLVVSEDTFEDGMSGWLQLATPSTTEGKKLGTVTRVERGQPRLHIRTPNASGIETMGLKRMSNCFGEGRYLFEMLMSFDVMAPAGDPYERPRYFAWGLDLCDDNGNRRFYKVRYLVYDETAGAVRHKLQLGDIGTIGTFTDVPGAESINYMFANNENKGLPLYCALLINTNTKTYEGLWVTNKTRIGALAETPNNSIASLGQVAASSLPSYLGGINPAVEILNRTAGFTAAGVNLHWARTTLIGG